ncbi:TetR/AcrR family transcriptional regulator [Streptomyces cacaoi]|uniref:TetR/AcrR family transcriptional regulator n=1 Tax=Streptomyces cacaoi TaxID=1898 RepID=UPI002617E165|nr:TetR/AcrR family transcriptional regulator [Streptomyces cacaoi]
MAARDTPTLRARERNRLVILDAARRVLADDPGAGMDDIAAAAGMVRRTLYGHFPTRQELVVNLVRAGAEEFIAHLDEIDQCAEDPSVEMAALVLGTWEAAQRFTPVIALARREANEALYTAMEPFNSRVAVLIGHGQRLGVFANDAAPDVLARVVDATAQAFLSAQEDGGAADVAFTALLTLGVPARKARASVRSARTRQGSCDGP